MRNGVRDHSVACQIVDAISDAAEAVFKGKPIEQASAKQRRIGIKDKRADSDGASPLPRRSVAVGPHDILGKNGRPATA